jgi:hypothetical protein
METAKDIFNPCTDGLFNYARLDTWGYPGNCSLAVDPYSYDLRNAQECPARTFNFFLICNFEAIYFRLANCGFIALIIVWIIVAFALSPFPSAESMHAQEIRLKMLKKESEGKDDVIVSADEKMGTSIHNIFLMRRQVLEHSLRYARDEFRESLASKVVFVAVIALISVICIIGPPLVVLKLQVSEESYTAFYSRMFVLVILAVIIVTLASASLTYFIFIHAPYCLRVCIFQLRSLAYHLDYICSKENENLAREDIRNNSIASGKSGRENDDIYLTFQEAQASVPNGKEEGPVNRKAPDVLVLCWVLDELQSWQKLRQFVTRYDYNFVYNSIGLIVGMCVLSALVGILFLIWSSFLLAQTYTGQDGKSEYPIYLHAGEITVITSCLFLIIVTAIGAIQFLLTYNSVLDMQDEHVRVVKQLEFYWRHELKRQVGDVNIKGLQAQIERIELIISQMEKETEPPHLLGFAYRRGMLTALYSYISTGFAAMFVGVFSQFFFQG